MVIWMAWIIGVRVDPRGTFHGDFGIDVKEERAYSNGNFQWIM